MENSKPPFIFQLPPEEGRKVLDKVQDTPVDMYSASIFTTEVNTGRYGKIAVNFVVPENCDEKRHVILYIHGAGWVFGSLHTHENWSANWQQEPAVSSSSPNILVLRKSIIL